MQQEHLSKTFVIQIQQSASHSWQGQLLAGGQSIPFHSEMELLLAMNRLMPQSVIRIRAQDNRRRASEGGKTHDD